MSSVLISHLHSYQNAGVRLLEVVYLDTDNCSVIPYYFGVSFKEKSSLGFNSDCVYSPINGDFVTSSNSQVENTPSVIYSIGENFNLHWKRRKIGLSNTRHSKWIDDPSFKSCYSLDSDTITILNPLDENSLSKKMS